MARDAALLRREERVRQDALRPARRQNRLDEAVELIRAHQADPRALGSRLEQLMDARGLSDAERADAWRQVEAEVGPELARRAFSGQPASGARSRVRDANLRRAAETEALLDRLADGLGVDRDVLTVDVSERAGAVTGARGARGVAVGNTVYLDPARYDPATAEGKSLLAHEAVHVAQRSNVDVSAAPTRGTGTGTTPARGIGPETEARALAGRFAAGGTIAAPEARIAAHAIAADTGADSEHAQERPEPVDPPAGLTVATDATEDELQNANESQGLDPLAHHRDGQRGQQDREGQPQRGPGQDEEQQPGDRRRQPGRQGQPPGRDPRRGKGKGDEQEGQENEGQEQGQDPAQQGKDPRQQGPDPAQPPGAGNPPPQQAVPQVAAPVVQPVRFGVGPAGQVAGNAREIIEERSDGTVVFVPNDPAQLDQQQAQGNGGPGQEPAVRALGPGQTEGIKQDRRQEAEAAVAAFTAAGEQKAAAIDQFRTGSTTQLAQAAATNTARVTAALEQNTAALRAAFESARRQVARNAAIATARVRAAAQSAREAVTAESTTRRAAIEQGATTAAQDVARMETALRTQVSQAFTTSAGNIRRLGNEKGQAAVRQGETAANGYTNPRAPDGGFFEGDEYNRNKQRARASAARDVAAAYRDEFVKKATETATAVLAAQGDVTQGIGDRIRAATDQITAAKDGALRQVTQSEQAANTAIDQALEQSVTAIAEQSRSNQASLRSAERQQTQTLQTSATAARQQISEQCTTLSRTVEEQLTQAATQIRTQVQSVTAMGQGADFPDTSALNQALGATLGELDGVVSTVQTSVGQNVSQQVAAAGTQAEGIETSFAQALQQGTEQANGIATGFATSSRQLATQASQGMTASATGHTTRGTQIAQRATEGMNQAKSGVQTDFTNIETNLATSLTKTERDFTTGLDQSLGDMAGTIRTKADEAASKVQPAWKAVLKIIINILAAIVVAIVIAALVASGVGLLAGVLIAGLVGAAVAVAKQAACDLVDGQMSSWQTYLGEAIGGAIGGVVGFVTAGAGAGWGQGIAQAVTGRIAGATAQAVAQTAIKITFDATVAGVTEVVTEVIKRAIDPEKDITWGAIGSAFLGGFVGGGVGSGMGKLPVGTNGLRVTQPIDRFVATNLRPVTEGLMRVVAPVGTNQLTNQVVGQTVRGVGRTVVDTGTSEVIKQGTGQVVNAEESDRRRATQSGARQDAQNSVANRVKPPQINGSTRRAP